MDPVLGVVSVSKSLDQRVRSLFELVLVASDHGSPPLHASATVNIAVTVSDNAPPRSVGGELD